MVTVDMHVNIILLAFNNSTRQSAQELKEITQLSDSDLSRILQTLVDAKILIAEVGTACSDLY